jgi:hypothetical protein
MSLDDKVNVEDGRIFGCARNKFDLCPDIIACHWPTESRAPLRIRPRLPLGEMLLPN